MTAFLTPEEYAFRYEAYALEMRSLLNHTGRTFETEHEQLKYISELQQKIRFYAPDVSISLLDVAEHLPILAAHGFSINRVTLHHRKAWGEEEYAVFRHRGQDPKTDTWLREPNTRRNLSRTFISMPRKFAILIDFEATTSEQHESDLDDTRPAIGIQTIVRPVVLHYEGENQE